MEIGLIEVGTNLGLTQKDVSVILDCVGAFPENDIEGHTHFIERVFLNNIKPAHYLLVGYLVGYLNATDQTYSEILNNNEPCQRVN